MQTSAAGSYNETHVPYSSRGIHKKANLADSLASDPSHHNHFASSVMREKYISETNQFSLLKNESYLSRGQEALDYCHVLQNSIIIFNRTEVILILGVLALVYVCVRCWLARKQFQPR